MSEVKGQGHNIISSIQLMHFLLVSHQLDRPFLIYMAKIMFGLEKIHRKFQKENLPKYQFPTELLQNLIR